MYKGGWRARLWHCCHNQGLWSKQRLSAAEQKMLIAANTIWQHSLSFLMLWKSKAACSEVRRRWPEQRNMHMGMSTLTCDPVFDSSSSLCSNPSLQRLFPGLEDCPNVTRRHCTSHNDRASQHIILHLPYICHQRLWGQRDNCSQSLILSHLRTIWECLEKKEKRLLFFCCCCCWIPSCKYKAGSYIVYFTMLSFFLSGLEKTSNYSFFMKRTTASGNLNLQEFGCITSLWFDIPGRKHYFSFA